VGTTWLLYKHNGSWLVVCEQCGPLLATPAVCTVCCRKQVRGAVGMLSCRKCGCSAHYQCASAWVVDRSSGRAQHTCLQCAQRSMHVVLEKLAV
jgi:hypothetical protein